MVARPLAERKLEQTETELAALNSYQPSQVLPRAREIYHNLVAELENLHDIPAARTAIREITGPISLNPVDGHLVAEIKQAAQGGLLNKINVVAGAGYVSYLPDTISIVLR